MSQPPKRTSSSNYKERYTRYRTRNIREKNKAKRVVKSVMVSRNPDTTIRKLQLSPVVRTFAHKLYYKK